MNVRVGIYSRELRAEVSITINTLTSAIFAFHYVPWFRVRRHKEIPKRHAWQVGTLSFYSASVLECAHCCTTKHNTYCTSSRSKAGTSAQKYARRCSQAKVQPPGSRIEPVRVNFLNGRWTTESSLLLHVHPTSKCGQWGSCQSPEIIIFVHAELLLVEVNLYVISPRDSDVYRYSYLQKWLHSQSSSKDRNNSRMNQEAKCTARYTPHSPAPQEISRKRGGLMPSRANTF